MRLPGRCPQRWRASRRSAMLGRVTTPQNLDERFRDAVSALRAARGPARARRTGPRRLRAHRRPCPATLRRPAHQPPPRPRRALAAQLQRGLLHDRIVRPRRKRGGGRRAAPGRPGAAALPVRRRSSCARAAAADPSPWWTRPGTCCAAWSPRPRSRSPAAGTRSSAAPTCTSSRPPRRSPRTCRGRSAWPSASPARRPTRGVASPWPADAIAVASFGDASVNHASATAAFNTAGWYDHAGVTAAAAAGLRGQRPRHQRAVAGRLGRRRRCAPGPGCGTPPRTAATWPPRTTPPPRRPTGSASSAGPAVLHLSMVRLMGHAGADAEVGVPLRRGHRPRPGPRPAGRHRAAARRGRPGHTRRADHPVRRGRLAGPQGRRGGARRAQTGLGRRGRRPARPAPAAARRPAPSPTRPTRAAGAGAAARLPGVRRQAARAGRPADPGPDHQRHAHRRAAGRAGRAGLRRGRGPQGRRVRRHQAPAGAVRRRPGLRHPARRDHHPGAGRWAPGWRAAADPGDPVPGVPAQRRGPAARRGGDDVVLLVRGVPQPDGASGWPAWPTSRASAGTSTTTTRWPCCATYPVWSSPCRPGPADAAPMLRSCLAVRGGGRQRLRLPRADRALPHPRPATNRATTSGWRRTPAPAEWAAEHVPIGRARTYPVGIADDLTILTFGNGAADVAAGRRAAGRRGVRLPRGGPALARPRCPRPTWSARPPPPAGC